MGIGPNGHWTKWALDQMGIRPNGHWAKWELDQMGLDQLSLDEMDIGRNGNKSAHRPGWPKLSGQ